MEELGAPFRATKDLDIVLIVEALDASFGECFGSLLKMVVMCIAKRVAGESVLSFHRTEEYRISKDD